MATKTLGSEATSVEKPGIRWANPTPEDTARYVASFEKLQSLLRADGIDPDELIAAINRNDKRASC